jgi:hypothetical protein
VLAFGTTVFFKLEDALEYLLEQQSPSNRIFHARVPHTLVHQRGNRGVIAKSYTPVRQVSREEITPLLETIAVVGPTERKLRDPTDEYKTFAEQRAAVLLQHWYQ